MSYAATIGFFDGVHKGHLFLLSELKRTAAVRGLRTLVVTFKEHPRLYLGGERPLLLTSTEDRVGLISACGIDDVKVLDFPEVRSMRAVEFMRLLHDKYDVRTLLMGYDHNFGSDGIRGIERYSEIGRQSEIDILPVPRAPEGGVSSSKIRMALLSGDVKTAVEMLGRPYSLTGKVVKGKGVGHSIGFPTANIQLPENLLVPRTGVYAVSVLYEDNRYDGVLNIGTNPTLGGQDVSIEVHLLNFEGDLYGKDIKVELYDFLRSEICFSSLDELQRQIYEDIIKAQTILPAMVIGQKMNGL